MQAEVSSRQGGRLDAAVAVLIADDATTRKFTFWIDVGAPEWAVNSKLRTELMRAAKSTPAGALSRMELTSQPELNEALGVVMQKFELTHTFTILD